MSTSPLIATMHQALGEPIGLAIACEEPARLRQFFYRERRNAADPTLEALHFVESRSDPSSELWIINRRPDDRA